MSLNKDMHPRNPYKNKPPDFKALALEFPEFRKFCKMTTNGKVYLNFQEDAAVRCLTKTLLKKDFSLDVELPIGTLVPRVPQRLNYCFLIDDLLKINKIDSNIVGIDIGTGASCIYSLLGAKVFNWRFIATDGDEVSVKTACENIERNKMKDRICVAHVDSKAKSLLLNVINEIGGNNNFAFCMCNPPFFENKETDQKFCAEPSLGGIKYSNRVVLEERPSPHSTTFASSAELEVEGGEVTFVNRIIDDSIILRDKISIYTSMLGKKQSIKPLRQRLERLGNDVKVIVSTLNQGKTQRWIIAWTFSSNISLTTMEKPIIIKCQGSIMSKLEEEMEKLDAIIRKENEQTILFECKKVTWTHQRARKRAKARLNGSQHEIFAKKAKLQISCSECQASLGNGDGLDSLSDSGNFVNCEMFKNGEKTDSAVQAFFPVPEKDITNQGLRFRVRKIHKSNIDNYVSFELLNGPKHHLHQLIQFLKNVLFL